MGARHASRTLCPLLTIAEAAARLGCEPAALWALLHKGELPGVVHLTRYFVQAGRLDDVLEVLTRPTVKVAGLRGFVPVSLPTDS